MELGQLLVFGGIILALGAVTAYATFVGLMWQSVGASVEGLVQHPSFPPSVRGDIQSLHRLRLDIEERVAAAAPATEQQLADLMRLHNDADRALLELRQRLTSARGEPMHAQMGWQTRIDGWRRWTWVDSEIETAARLLKKEDKHLHQGRLNTADPAVAAEALGRALRAGWLRSGIENVSVRVESGAAYLEGDAPKNTVATTTAVYRGSGKNRRKVQVPRSSRDINCDYAALVATRAREAIATSFRTVPGLSQVAVSLYRSMTHQLRGNVYRGCVLSVVADRDGWNAIVHKNVSAENCLRNFQFAFKYDRDFVLQEVAPIRAPGQLRAATLRDPMDLDPLAFESLIRDLLQSMGYVATLTKQSHDGGIDIEAENPRPIVGGKVVVQCKRYSGTIGSPVVRDLYGVVTDTRATKGVLITTSDFSPDATQFANGKQLELINGTELRRLLEENGLLGPTNGQGRAEASSETQRAG